MVWNGLFSAVVTLATGLVSSTPTKLLGAAWYGWPVTWLRKLVLAPQYNPWIIDWYSIIQDLVIWFIVGWIILYLSNLYKPKPGRVQPAVKSKARQKRRRR